MPWLVGRPAKIALLLLVTAYIGWAGYHFGDPTERVRVVTAMTFLSREAVLRCTILDWIAILALPISLICLYLIFRRARPPAARFFKIHERYIAVLVMALSLIGFACFHFYDDHNVTSIAILITALCATAGWLFTTYMGGLNARKAHTMSILVQMRTSPEFNKHKANIMARFPNKSRLSEEDVRAILADKNSIATKNAPPPLNESMIYVLNFFEFICAGAHLEDLDERILRETVRSIFINFYNFSEEYIDRAVEDDFGKRNDRIYRHFRFFVAHLKSAPP